MDALHVQRSVLGWPICVDLFPAGDNWLVRITGGCAPHIGSVSVGSLENGEVVLRSILLPTHRDDVVGNRFAQALARHLQTTVCVTCGIHYDAPGKEGLQEIVACCEALLQELLEQLPEESPR